MTRILLIAVTVMVSFHNSHSRPQTLFSQLAQAFSPANIQNSVLGNIDTAFDKTFSQRDGRRQFSNQPTSRKRQYSFRTSFRSASSKGSGDFIEQTRRQADELKSSLRSLARMSSAYPMLDEMFEGENSDCINNMNQAIDAIETSTRLMENSGTELKQLVEMVKEFQSITDTPKAVRQSAKIIRLLDVLIPKLSPPSSFCQTNDKDVIDSMLSLESLISKLSNKDDLYYTPQVRQRMLP